MLINESGLVRCIKRAYRSAGYAVVTQDDSMAIYTEQWYVQCKRAALPRKVLATIVEHMGMIPDTAPMSIIKDGDPQLIMPDVAMDEIPLENRGTHRHGDHGHRDHAGLPDIPAGGRRRLLWREPVRPGDHGAGNCRAWAGNRGRRGPPAMVRGQRSGGPGHREKGPVKLGKGMGAGRVERPGGRRSP